MKLIGEFLKWGYSEARVPLNQVLFTSCIDICLSCLQVGTRCHLFTSTRCLLFTRVYNVLQVHVSPRSDVTFENDVALRNTSSSSATKKGSKVVLHTTHDVIAYLS